METDERTRRMTTLGIRQNLAEAQEPLGQNIVLAG